MINKRKMPMPTTYEIDELYKDHDYDNKMDGQYIVRFVLRKENSSQRDSEEINYIYKTVEIDSRELEYLLAPSGYDPSYQLIGAELKGREYAVMRKNSVIIKKDGEMREFFSQISEAVNSPDNKNKKRKNSKST